ncbi:PLP-dependent aminotransferase family protein [Segnochrobactraceae bacterium EtOH-i3]
MPDLFFPVPVHPGEGLQRQIHARLVEAILDGTLSPFEALPASRVLAERIGVSRNTVVLVYERLAEDGFLRAVPRRGYFINEVHVRRELAARVAGRTGSPDGADAAVEARLDRLRLRPTSQRNIVKPADWRSYPYPFIYGQVNVDRITLARWRDCARLAGAERHSAAWVVDLIDADDPTLIAQIVSRVLPRRGIRARPEEVLITIGAQNALFLIATLLGGAGTVAGVEDPGYVDARNILSATGATLRALPVDAGGVRLGPELTGCDLIHVTPSHQSPTSVTLGMERRLALLERAEREDFWILEDDYEHELNYVGAQRPALRALDSRGRVLHVGSLTKPIFPGLRMGFIVAAPGLIRELRALRRLMYRHPPALDQRAMALFLAEGHFDAHILRARQALARKWRTLFREVDRLLPDCRALATTGGSAVWLELPAGVDGRRLATAAASRGVLVEPGDVHFAAPRDPCRYLRLGFAAIAHDRIAPGLSLLAEALAEVRAAGGVGAPGQEIAG